MPADFPNSSIHTTEYIKICQDADVEADRCRQRSRCESKQGTDAEINNADRKQVTRTCSEAQQLLKKNYCAEPPDHLEVEASKTPMLKRIMRTERQM